MNDKTQSPDGEELIMCAERRPYRSHIMGDRPWAGAGSKYCEWGGKGNAVIGGEIMGGFLEEAALELTVKGTEYAKLQRQGVASDICVEMELG